MNGNALIDWLAASGIVYDEGAILKEQQKRQQATGHKVVRGLTVIGTFMASVLLLSSLFAIGLYENATSMFITGVAGFAGGLWLHRKEEKEVVDTFAISLALMGYTSIGFALSDWKAQKNLLYLTLGLLSAITFYISRRYILPFLSVVSFFSLSYFWIGDRNIPIMAPAISAVILGLLWWLYFREEDIAARFRLLSVHYLALCLGLIVSVLLSHYLFIPMKDVGFAGTKPPHYALYFAIPTSFFCLLAQFRISEETGVSSLNARLFLSAGIGLVLALAVYAPAISLSLFLLLLAFRLRYYTGLVLSLVSLLVALSLWYYDLQFSLLTKSILLMTSGSLFLAAFLIISHYSKRS